MNALYIAILPSYIFMYTYVQCNCHGIHVPQYVELPELGQTRSPLPMQPKNKALAMTVVKSEPSCICYDSKSPVVAGGLLMCQHTNVLLQLWSCYVTHRPVLS